jgi:hypothetical protein
MVTYLLSVGYNATHVGIVRTVSVILELGATWAAPILMAKIGPIRSGIWFLNCQLLCLIGAGGFFYGANSATVSAAGLVIGTMLSRVGLWGFDLSAQILVQNVSCSSKEPDLSRDTYVNLKFRKFNQAKEVHFHHKKPDGKTHSRCYLLLLQ